MLTNVLDNLEDKSIIDKVYLLYFFNKAFNDYFVAPIDLDNIERSSLESVIDINK